MVVTVNYRLGPWGELSLDSGRVSVPCAALLDCTVQVSGNQGLRDQILALTWVQQYIATFGGDPEQVTQYLLFSESKPLVEVTIAGESAGSWSVFHHLLSPGSAGLFRAVIGQAARQRTLMDFMDKITKLFVEHPANCDITVRPAVRHSDLPPGGHLLHQAGGGHQRPAVRGGVRLLGRRGEVGS